MSSPFDCRARYIKEESLKEAFHMMVAQEDHELSLGRKRPKSPEVLYHPFGCNIPLLFEEAKKMVDG